ncbi:hypothetical protein GQ53DRAFT_746626 [Thozetella sp. PMI_491]|nr:hypothetical protein GQ53DRAFT_746626 [Thozetella sp. PMI_491]
MVPIPSRPSAAAWCQTAQVPAASAAALPASAWVCRCLIDTTCQVDQLQEESANEQWWICRAHQPRQTSLQDVPSQANRMAGRGERQAKFLRGRW